MERGLLNREVVETLFRVKRNQIAMIEDRGYRVNPADTDFLAVKNGEQLVAWVAAQGQPSTYRGLLLALSQTYAATQERPTLRVRFMTPNVGHKSILTDEATEFVEELVPEGAGVLISDSVVSRDAFNRIMKLAVFQVTLFTFDQLRFNPTRNILVPKHRLLPKEEAEEVRKELGLKANQFPLIQVDDAIAKWFGAVQNQIFEITRKDTLPGTMVNESLFYRLVVERRA